MAQQHISIHVPLRADRDFHKEKRALNRTGWRGVEESELGGSVTRVRRHWLLRLRGQNHANVPCSHSTTSHSIGKGDRRNCQPDNASVNSMVLQHTLLSSLLFSLLN